MADEEDDGLAAPTREELEEALVTYRESLADLRGGGSDEEETLEMISELEAAVKLTEEALAEGEWGAPAGDDDDKGRSPVLGTPAGPPERSAGPPEGGGLPRGAAAAGVRGAGNNDRIHPLNKYAAAEPDFAALAKEYPALARHVRVDNKGRGHIDFRSYEATVELTRCLLEHDYGVRGWLLPGGQLCPAVTNRANYIHWIHDLLHVSSPQGAGGEGASGAGVKGLDVGVGASCIYPLLGAASHGWSFVGTDVTPEALAGARANVSASPHLSRLIEIRDARDPSRRGKGGGEGADKGPWEGGEPHPVLEGVVGEGERLSFTMCNPPFFATLEEAELNPHTACGGTAAEMVFPGGELAFLQRMVDDSAQLRGQVHWYTTMVGKKATLKSLQAALPRRGARAVRTTELCQGRTSRWAIAWSFAPGAAGAAGAAPLPSHGRAATRPRARRSASWTVRLPGVRGARGGGGGGGGGAPGGAAAVLEAVAAALRAAGAACEADASNFRIAGALPAAGPAAAAPPPAKRAKPDSGGGVRGGGASFEITVFHVPGELTLAAGLKGGGAQHAEAFGALLGAVEDRLPWLH